MNRSPALFACFCGLIFPAKLLAQEPKPSPPTEQTKQEALAWLTSFSRYQVLFHADDVKKLKERVEAMTPEEAAKWWDRTAPQRKVLASPEWAETENWLRQFLDVQARYSDEEIRARQKEAAEQAKESAGSLQEVLDRITKARRALVGGAQAAQQTRELQLAANQSFRQEEVRQREAARARAAAAPTPAPGRAPPARPSGPTRFNEPLINSLDVARWAVLREIYPAW
jgi:hypothetical protein